jgi:hypothetical protein
MACYLDGSMNRIEELKAKWAPVKARREMWDRRSKTMSDLACRGIYGEHARKQGGTWSLQFEFQTSEAAPQSEGEINMGIYPFHPKPFLWDFFIYPLV